MSAEMSLMRSIGKLAGVIQARDAQIARLTAERDSACSEVTRLTEALMWAEVMRDAYRAALAEATHDYADPDDTDLGYCAERLDDVKGRCDEQDDHPVHQTPERVAAKLAEGKTDA